MYSEADIAALIAATGTPHSPLRRATFAVLIGLLAVSEIRVGEAIALDRNDVDLNDGRLLVRHGKLGKTPELVLHPTTVAGLHQHQRLRDRLAPASGTSAFVSTPGTRLHYCNVHAGFHRLVELAGLAPRSGTCRPRIHHYAGLRVTPALRDACQLGTARPERIP